MKKQYRELLKSLSYYSGFTSLLEFLKAPSENRLLILMYHDVVTDSEQRTHWYNSDIPNTTQLEALFVAIKRHYRAISVEDAVSEILNTGRIQTKSIAITFDDGYRGTYSLLYPLLKKHGIPATIYLPTYWIDGRMSPWWITLTDLIDQSTFSADKITRVEELMNKATGAKPNMSHHADTTKTAFHDQVGSVLMRLDDGIRERLMHELQSVLLQDRPFVSRDQQPLTWKQIGEMADNGVRFGAHTCSHRNLSYLDMAIADQEIGESKRVIQQRLGVDTVGFAYPYGYDVDGYRRLRPLFEKHGYHYACTSWWGHVDSQCDRFLLARTCLAHSNSPSVLARSLSLEYCMKKWPSPPGLNEWPLHAK